jgi:hypothetical protein
MSSHEYMSDIDNAKSQEHYAKLDKERKQKEKLERETREKEIRKVVLQMKQNGEI